MIKAAGQNRQARSASGGLWTHVDITFERKGDTDYLGLMLAVKWNQSVNIFTGFPTSPYHRKLYDEVQKALLPQQGTAIRGDIANLTPQAFYETAFIPDNTQTNILSSSIPDITAKLFPFQRRALQWLLSREHVRWVSNAPDGTPLFESLVPESSHGLPLSFVQVEDADGYPYYYSDIFRIVTRDIAPFCDLEASLRGGILAEEMGLGKTVETISLIAMHRRPVGPSTQFDHFTGQEIRTTGATLIVTPETLKNQWLSEVRRHSPALRVMAYNGRKSYKAREEDLVHQLADHDIVITTYTVLQSEIHFAQPPPDRAMRHERRHARPTSPLMQLFWWRVCLDEAQQIESGVSAAARVARLIPRVNAWGVTGTPVKDDVKDLWGLLLFLRLEPFASFPTIWDSIISTHQDLFKVLFQRISMRHTKQVVRSELTLPPQKRYIITMPFTAIEEQNYESRFQSAAQSCGLDKLGAPLLENWDPEDPETITFMKRALAQLRRTVLHPELAPGRGRVLTQKNKPLRTIDEVLDAMIEETESSIKTHQRTYFLSKLRRGQLLENSPRVREALAIWQEVLEEAESLVTECREQLQAEVDNVRNPNTQGTINAIGSESEMEFPDSDDEDVSPRVGEARRKLRTALDLKHRAVFFIASAYFQIKSNEEMTTPDSDEFKRLEKLEVEGYEEAKVIRKEILQEAHAKASSYMNILKKKAASQSFVEIPEYKSSLYKGLESRRVSENLDQLGALLDEQANLVDEWREHVIQLLLRPLVDEEGEAEITGEEYEDSTKIQDELMVYTHVLRAAIADRQDAFSGLVNERVRHETKFAEVLARQDEGPSPKKLLMLLEMRDEKKPTKVGTSLRGIISDLRELATKLRHDAGNSSTSRATVELGIVQEYLRLTLDQTAEQSKAATTLEKELDYFTAAMNARVEYYRQLQAVSDTVAVWERGEDENDELLMNGLLAEEEKTKQKISAAIATHRYQVHLKNQGQNSTEKTCPICKDTYTLGALTDCTHEFCRDCITLWVKAHRKCPLCKKALALSSLQDIVVKKPELKLHSESHSMLSGEHISPHRNRKSGIYVDFSEANRRAIQDIQLDGPSFATKIDTLIRHLHWLRQADPGAKSIIFSQFGGFLDILKRAFAKYKIGFSSFETKNGIIMFKEDPAIECFLMDARSHASGLNLVNANHVFLCEPLLNTALELQAIARVDRIGQEHETTVWLYLVEGTVEESIYNLSVQRRLEHMGNSSDGKGKSRASSPGTQVSDRNLEAANSLELQQAALPKLMDKDQQLGEVIDKNDLWDCLFGHVARESAARAEQQAQEDSRFGDRRVVSFLAGRAAEERRAAVEQLEEEQELKEAMAEIQELGQSSETEGEDSDFE
ncbi:SNF2 family N-terminal domain-containing protein [Xylariales sp. PMI_506]|nr:SNF2 family N-terminal domain-containing protein [Xylariales sp. PMI_506]